MIDFAPKFIPPAGENWPGDCRACGQELLKNAEGRIFHPVEIIVDGDICPALIESPTTGAISFDVPMSCFIPWDHNPYKED